MVWVCYNTFEKFLICGVNQFSYSDFVETVMSNIVVYVRRIALNSSAYVSESNHSNTIIINSAKPNIKWKALARRGTDHFSIISSCDREL